MSTDRGADGRARMLPDQDYYGSAFGPDGSEPHPLDHYHADGSSRPRPAREEDGSVVSCGGAGTSQTRRPYAMRTDFQDGRRRGRRWTQVNGCYYCCNSCHTQWR